MQSDLLREAGEALYGPHWQSELARQLGVSDRTVRRWAVAATPLPTRVAADLLRLCLERAELLDGIVERLRRAAAA